jgi:16S rRNA (uracil1498-N3)-methyltransferase
MDWLVQKAVEIGVGSLIPLCAERSQLKLQTATGRLEHWRRIAFQALKQCHRPWVMDVASPIDLAELVSSRGVRAGLVADPNGCSCEQLAIDEEPLLLVGPEGGFTASESELLETADWRRVRLGRYVLRAETAVTVGAAMLAEKVRNNQLEARS